MEGKIKYALGIQYAQISSLVGHYELGDNVGSSLLQVMANQEACDCIKDIEDAKNAAKKLVKEAKSQGSYDDISCIVVKF